MEVQLTPDLEKKLNDLATESGRGAGEVVQDALAGYFAELAGTRELLNNRYDDLKAGGVKPIDGEEFFESLRRREDDLLRKHSRQCRRIKALRFIHSPPRTSRKFGNTSPKTIPLLPDGFERNYLAPFEHWWLFRIRATNGRTSLRGRCASRWYVNT